MKQHVAWLISGVSLAVIATTGYGNEMILRKAIIYNDFAAISNYAQNGGDINIAETGNGKTALHFAASENQLKIAKLLVEHQANVNARDYRGFTPLHWAAFKGHMDMAAFLLQHKAEINATNLHGLTPLHLATQYGHEDVISFLLDSGANLNARTYDLGMTPIHWAAFCGHTDGLKALLDHGVDVNIPDSTGDTPLAWAEYFLHYDMARLIARKGGKHGSTLRLNLNTED